MKTTKKPLRERISLAVSTALDAIDDNRYFPHLPEDEHPLAWIPRFLGLSERNTTQVTSDNPQELNSQHEPSEPPIQSDGKRRKRVDQG